MSEWLPIDTAPRPRPRAMLVSSKTGAVAFYADGVIHNVIGSPWDWEYGEAITHWMPLPSPPKEPEPTPDTLPSKSEH